MDIRMLTYADVCRRMLTYANVCRRTLTYATGANTRVGSSIWTHGCRDRGGAAAGVGRPDRGGPAVRDAHLPHRLRHGPKRTHSRGPARVPDSRAPKDPRFTGTKVLACWYNSTNTHAQTHLRQTTPLSPSLPPPSTPSSAVCAAKRCRYASIRRKKKEKMRRGGGEMQY